MTYKEQLQHPEWKKLKARIISEAGGQCTTCRCFNKPLHVHHICYIAGRMVWEYADCSLICLCEDCHKKQHPNGNSSGIPRHAAGWVENITSTIFDMFAAGFEWA